MYLKETTYEEIFLSYIDYRLTWNVLFILLFINNLFFLAKFDEAIFHTDEYSCPDEHAVVHADRLFTYECRHKNVND